MTLQVPKAPVLIANPRSESEASHLIIKQLSIPQTGQPIGEIEVKSKEQPHISLGNYSIANPPKGFAIHITPDPEPDAIITQITSLGTEEEYELVLHIANYGNRTVSAEVWKA